MIRQKGPKSLTDLCLDKIRRSDLSHIDFTGVPPHLIAKILQFVRSPEELAEIQDFGMNNNSKIFQSVVEDKWNQLVLSKYWRGKPNPPVLPPNGTWRMFFDECQRKEMDHLQFQREQAYKEAPQKKKKSATVLDGKKMNMLLRSAPSSRSRSYSNSNSSKSGSNVGELGQKFLKKLSRMYF